MLCFQTENQEDLVYFLYHFIKCVKVFSEKRLRGTPI